jgi:hypothetical protein
VEENQKETGDVSDPTSADAGEMPSGWITRGGRANQEKSAVPKYNTWKSPPGGVFRSLHSIHKFLEENAQANSKNGNL